MTSDVSMTSFPPCSCFKDTSGGTKSQQPDESAERQSVDGTKLRFFSWLSYLFCGLRDKKKGLAPRGSASPFSFN